MSEPVVSFESRGSDYGDSYYQLLACGVHVNCYDSAEYDREAVTLFTERLNKRIAEGDAAKAKLQELKELLRELTLSKHDFIPDDGEMEHLVALEVTFADAASAEAVYENLHRHISE